MISEDMRTRAANELRSEAARDLTIDGNESGLHDIDIAVAETSRATMAQRREALDRLRTVLTARQVQALEHLLELKRRSMMGQPGYAGA